jgi:hypothetical protein
MRVLEAFRGRISPQRLHATPEAVERDREDEVALGFELRHRVEAIG